MVSRSGDRFPPTYWVYDSRPTLDRHVQVERDDAIRPSDDRVHLDLLDGVVGGQP